MSIFPEAVEYHIPGISTTLLMLIFTWAIIIALVLSVTVADLLARGIQTNYLWRGGFEELVNEWVYVGPSISGYNEGFSETCCNQGGCCKQHLDIPINASTFDNVVKMAKYGIDWLSDHPLEDPYRRASVETLAHVIACFVTQNFTNEPTPTEDMVGLIEDMPDEDIFRGRLTAYIL